MKNILRKCAYSVGAATFFTLIFECARYINIDFIIGSDTAFFSFNQCLTPLVGVSTHFLSVATLILFLRSLFHSTTQIAPALLIYHIPSFFGAIAFSHINSQRNTIWLPRILLGSILLLCTILFIAHPIGYSAAPYTLLWLTPALLLWLPKKHPFVHALISTFIAHAVGSVLWLYFFTEQSASIWISIMPIALIERIIFASGTTICYYSMHALYRFGSECILLVRKKISIESSL